MESADNVLSVHQKIFDCIDALPDVKSAKAAADFFDVHALKKIFWQSLKTYFTTKNRLEKRKARLKCMYINRYFNSGIPLNANIQPFVTPHGFYGIFISGAAKIGKGCTIFHQVTIGSNTIPDSKNAGAPAIGDNVYIGTGAKIIGNVKIGNNVRIGAGCVVTRDVPDNCTVVPAANVIIQKDAPQNNRWLSLTDYRKLKAGKSTQDNSITTPPQSTIIR